MGGIGSFTRANDRESSDVRIYCDEDETGPGKRWTLVPDIANDPNPNSGRTLGHDQEWEDLTNHVRRHPTTQGCKDVGTLGETFCGHRPSGVVPPNENKNRCTISVSHDFLLSACSRF